MHPPPRASGGRRGPRFFLRGISCVVTLTAQQLEQLAPSGFFQFIAVDVGYTPTEQQLSRFKDDQEEGVTNLTI